MVYYPDGLAGLYNWAKTKLAAVLSRGAQSPPPQAEA